MENDGKANPPGSVILLYVLVGFQAVSALWGGLVLMVNPSGSLMQLPLSFLDDTLFADFFIPGLILFSILGVFTALVFWGLIKRPDWKWSETINVYRDQFWAWTCSLYVGFILILWIDFQILMIGGGHILQTIYAFLGVLILAVTLMPSVKGFYKRTGSDTVEM